MKQKQRIVQVDAFTNQPFAGNPAAVCVLDAPRDAGWMQSVAREMNLSETAFLHPEADGYRLRWFTPAVEVDLCGHATLASAHVLWESKHLARDQQARFFTRSGLLTARRQGKWIEMDFPARLATPAAPPPDLLAALGIAHTRYIGRNQDDYLVVVELPDTVRALQPDFTRLARVTARGVIVTSRSYQPEYQFISRFFAPAVGVPEDPVTGSAHCALAPYWAAQLNTTALIGYQASARGGMVRVEVAGERVLLGGQAVTVLRGTLHA